MTRPRNSALRDQLRDLNEQVEAACDAQDLHRATRLNQDARNLARRVYGIPLSEVTKR